jgi:hypothetical protein
MQITGLCIVLLTHLHPISAIFENAQAVHTEGDVEIRVYSSSKEPNEKILSEHASSSSFKVPSELQDNVTIINVRPSLAANVHQQM